MAIKKYRDGIARFISGFTAYYQSRKNITHPIEIIRYRIVSTLNEFHRNGTIELGFVDNPGDFLKPMRVEEIKSKSDILSGMHPIDVNSINDLYYLSRDNIVEISVENGKVFTKDKQSTILEYDLNKSALRLDNIASTRVSYMLGYLHAQTLLEKSTDNSVKYSILSDNISTLHIKDLNSETSFLRKPADILFSGEYKQYSKDDIARIGYICGQLAKTH